MKFFPCMKKERLLFLRTLAACFLFLLLLAGIFSAVPVSHRYDITAAWKDKNPGKTRIYYAHDQYRGEDSVGTELSFPEGKFRIVSEKEIRHIRLDLDEAIRKGECFFLTSLQVNNVLFSAQELYSMISQRNQCTVELKDDRLIIRADGKNMADDLFVSFDPPSRYTSVDFWGSRLLCRWGLFLLFAAGGCFLICFLAVKKEYLSSFAAAIRKCFSDRTFLKSQLKNFWKKHEKKFFLILFILFSCFVYQMLPHFYDVVITFEGEDPGGIELFYTADSFNSSTKRMRGNDRSLSKKFSVISRKRVNSFRFDFEELPDGTRVTVKEVRINGVSIPNSELNNYVVYMNQAERDRDPDKIRFIARKYDDKTKQYSPFADDAFFVLAFPAKYRFTDFKGSMFFAKTIVLLLVIVSFATALFFLSREKVHLFLSRLYSGFILRFSKEILLLFAVLSFLFLRYIVYETDFNDLAFFLCEDAKVAFLIGLLAVFSILFKRKVLTWLFFTFLLGIYLIWFIDIFLKADLNARFIFSQTGNWTPHAKDMLPMVKKAVSQTYSLLEALVTLSTLLLFITLSRQKKRPLPFLIFAAAVTGVTALISVFPTPMSIFDTSRKNIFSYNMMQGVYTKYSSGYIESVEDFQPEYRCVKGMNRKRDVILLVVESLSTFQSRRLSGLPFDNLKHFDSSLDEASSFSANYHCSSYNTVTNFFSLLSGFYPVLRPTGSVFDDRKYYEHSLSKEFRREGYKTIYFAPSTLVDNLGKVIERSDFDSLILDTDPFYAKSEHFVFNSVSDDVSLKRLVLLTEEHKNGTKPLFVIARTMTMHSPYMDPVSRAYSYEATVRFFDPAYKVFLDELKKSGYFERGGILVVTGDHRAMVPIGSEEQLKIGTWAIQKVPLVIYGKDVPLIDRENTYTHADLHFSIQYLMLDQAWKYRFQRNIFAPDQNKDFFCCFFQQCLNPSQVLISTPAGDGVIFLNGDNTKIDCRNLTPDQKKLIESYLLWVRAK